MKFDDSAIFHGTYDPVKAREYYLRTRQLKGRRPTTATQQSPGKGGRRPSAAPANRSNTKSRRAELEAQRDALEQRLDRLREVLREKVAAAKKLSGAEPKKDRRAPAPQKQASKASGGKSGKSDKPLTSAQKSEKAKAAKKAYEKENPTSLSKEVKELQSDIKDMRARIQTAIEDARRLSRTKAGGNKKR